MNNNEIVVNEEVRESTEEIVMAGVSKGFKIAGGIGLAILGGVIAYKYVVKPMVARNKAKKALLMIDPGSSTGFGEDA
jgi:hypothetical protein